MNKSPLLNDLHAACEPQNGVLIKIKPLVSEQLHLSHLVKKAFLHSTNSNFMVVFEQIITNFVFAESKLTRFNCMLIKTP